MEMMLDKNQIWAIFLFVQNGMVSSRDILQHQQCIWPMNCYERAVQWWFKKFCKGDETLEDEHGGWSSEVDNNELRASLKLILFQLLEKLLKNWALVIVQSFGVRSKLERWKSLIVGASWVDWKSKKLFPSVVSSYSMQQQQTISWSDCDMQQKVDFIWQSAMTQWLDREEAPKHFPEPNLHQNVMVTIWWSSAGLIH